MAETGGGRRDRCGAERGPGRSCEEPAPAPKRRWLWGGQRPRLLRDQGKKADRWRAQETRRGRLSSLSAVARWVSAAGLRGRGRPGSHGPPHGACGAPGREESQTRLLLRPAPSRDPDSVSASPQTSPDVWHVASWKGWGDVCAASILAVRVTSPPVALVFTAFRKRVKFTVRPGDFKEIGRFLHKYCLHARHRGRVLPVGS